MDSGNGLGLERKTSPPDGPLVSACPLCGSGEAKVTSNARVAHSEAERLVLDLAALVGVKVVVHLVRLVECPDCHPGRITRHREAIVPLDAEYAKRHLSR